MKRAFAFSFDLFITAAALGTAFYALTGLAFVTSWDTHLFFEEHPAVFVLSRAGLIAFAAGLLVIQKKITGEPFPFFSKRWFSGIDSFQSAVLLTLIYFFSLFIYQVFLHKGFMTSLWDLGIYDQVIWNTAFGDFMITSVRGGVHVFAERFKPLFVPLALLYRIQDNVNLLFLASTLLDSLSILFTFLIARQILNKDGWALVAALCVFFYAPLRNSINFLFHTQTFADPLLLICFYCGLKNRNRLFFFFFLLAMLCKESVIIDCAGLSLFLIYRKDKRGWSCLALTALMLFIFTRIVEPAFFYEHTFMNKWSYFAHFWNPTFDNWNKLLSPNPLVFLVLIGAPFLFLPFLGRGALFLLGPSLAFRLLNGYPGFRLTTAHYTAGLNALMIIAFLYGLNRFLSRNEQTADSRKKWAVLLTAVIFSGLPLMMRFEKAVWEASFPPNQQAAYFLQRIPKELSVLTSESLAAQLAHRPRLYVFGNMWPETPYQEDLKQPDLIISDITRRQESEVKFLEEYQSRGYERITEHSLFEIYAADQVLDVPNRENVLRLYQESLAIKTIPYRKKIRAFYKRILLAGLLIAGFVLLTGRLRRKRKAD